MQEKVVGQNRTIGPLDPNDQVSILDLEAYSKALLIAFANVCHLVAVQGCKSSNQFS